MEQLSKKAILLINIIFLQAFLVIFNGLWISNLGINPSSSSGAITKTTIFIGAVLTILAIFTVNEIIRLTQKEKQAELSKLRLAENQEMIDVLRTQRHDFLNHLQVISGLVQLKKYDRVSEYIKDVTGEMGIASKVANIKRPEIAALLVKKSNELHAKAIKINYNVDSLMDKLAVPPMELVSIAGNLIDNAVQAVENLTMDDRKINISFREEGEQYLIDINNPGPPIPEEIQEHIFVKGFSTKSGSGRGYGLHIVKSLVEKNHGRVILESEAENGTTFSIRFPKGEQVVQARVGQQTSSEVDKISLGGS